MSALTNPRGPLKSAKSLLAEYTELPEDLRRHLEKPLATWLAARPDCLRRGTAGTDGLGQSDTERYFRRAKAASKQAGKTLRSLVRSVGHQQDHPEQAVREISSKALRSIRSDRATFSQIEQLMFKMRSRLNTTGRRRAYEAPVRVARIYAAAFERVWKEIVTPKELEQCGRELGICTASPNSQARYYARMLKNSEMRFFALKESGRTIGLVSIRVADNTIQEARGFNNELLKTYKRSILLLLQQTKAKVKRCDDLISLGIADGFLDIDRKRPDLRIGTLSMWRGKTGSFLLKKEERWHWCQMRVDRDGEKSYTCRGDCDSDDILGFLLSHVVEEDEGE